MYRVSIYNDIINYNNVETADLQSMPTRDSVIFRRLAQGDEFSVYGYIESGEIIKESGRWYYVRTSLDAGNRIGYIHSSFVSFTGGAFRHAQGLQGFLMLQTFVPKI
jgi:hypothetical protein